MELPLGITLEQLLDNSKKIIRMRERRQLRQSGEAYKEMARARAKAYYATHREAILDRIKARNAMRALQALPAAPAAEA